MSSIIPLAVHSCKRCGGDHKEPLKFVPFKKSDEGWSHWTLCPTNGEPIVLKVGGGHHAPQVPAMALTFGVAKLNVHQCPRCGEQHPDFHMDKLLNPPDEFDHYGICPKTGQPVFCRIIRSTCG